MKFFISFNNSVWLLFMFSSFTTYYTCNVLYRKQVHHIKSSALYSTPQRKHAKHAKHTANLLVLYRKQVHHITVSSHLPFITNCFQVHCRILDPTRRVIIHGCTPPPRRSMLSIRSMLHTFQYCLLPVVQEIGSTYNCFKSCICPLLQTAFLKAKGSLYSCLLIVCLPSRSRNS